MRVANLLVLASSAMLAWACASTDLSDPPPGTPASVEVNGNDCAVLAAIAKEHYRFGVGSPGTELEFAL